MTRFIGILFFFCVFFCVLSLPVVAPASELPTYFAKVVRIYDVPEARQGVAVSADHFYVADSRAISRRNKMTGALEGEWKAGPAMDALIHLDSLVHFEGRLYAAHSNYPGLPMTSSVEIWSDEDLQHIGNHSFGIDRGSFTWLDRHDSFWWGGFGNYDKVQSGQQAPYGGTNNTQIVKLNDQFEVLESWVLPLQILDRMRPMSNSGGSWGPDGFLYLTGHDHGEAYVLNIPSVGSTLDWIATVKIPVVEGQGIAWDRTVAGLEMWGIRKADRKVVQVAMPAIPAAASPLQRSDASD